MAKPLPPGQRPGTIDLLDPTDEHPSDPDWRADALGRSRHSRLADEMRPPIDDPNPARAELVCARISREALREYAPALILLSKRNRRRAQALTAWAVTLFDLALRPGLAGLDGDRLAQINAWEFRTEEALDGNPPGQPVFVAMARENQRAPWQREALDQIVAATRRAALAPRERDPEAAQMVPLLETRLARAVLEALFAASAEAPESQARALAPLVVATPSPDSTGRTPALEGVDPSAAPPGGGRAAGYVKRVRLATQAPGIDGLGLAARLRLLIAAAIRPR